MSSKSNSKQESTNTDKRIAVQDGLAVSADHSTVNVTDGGAVARVMDTVDITIPVLFESYEKLLNSTTSVFDMSERMFSKTQDSFVLASVEQQGTIDNKTITMLALTGAAAAVGIAIAKR